MQHAGTDADDRASPKTRIFAPKNPGLRRTSDPASRRSLAPSDSRATIQYRCRRRRRRGNPQTTRHQRGRMPAVVRLDRIAPRRSEPRRTPAEYGGGHADTVRCGTGETRPAAHEASTVQHRGRGVAGIFFVTVLAWGWSFHRTQLIAHASWQPTPRLWRAFGIGFQRGVLVCGGERFRIAPNQDVDKFISDSPPGWHLASFEPDKSNDDCGWFGSVFSTHRPGLGTVAGDEVSHSVLIRFWPLAAVFSILPAVRLRTARRQQRLARQGRCTACGYDLRATPDRCPECGAAS